MERQGCQLRTQTTHHLLLIALLSLALLLVACGGSPSDGSGTETVTGGESAQDDTAGEAAEEPGEAALGTRQNPVPLGTEVKVGPNWNIAILQIDEDAWPIVEQTNRFNDPPAEGRQFVMASTKVSYNGEDSGTPWVSLSYRYLGSDGNVYGRGGDDRCGVLPKPLSDIGEQFPGASAEGQVCWSVPAEAVANGAIIVEESFSFDDTRVFFEGVN